MKPTMQCVYYYYYHLSCTVFTSASKSSIRRFVIKEKAPTGAFSWLKVPTSAFTFKNLGAFNQEKGPSP